MPELPKQLLRGKTKPCYQILKHGVPYVWKPDGCRGEGHHLANCHIEWIVNTIRTMEAEIDLTNCASPFTIGILREGGNL